MQPVQIEKRRYPRIDTSKERTCRIVIYGVKGRPVEENQIMNLSLGGVAFNGSLQSMMQTLKWVTTRVKIKLPDGKALNAETTLLRVKPKKDDDDCLCVFELKRMSKTHSTRLASFIPL